MKSSSVRGTIFVALALTGALPAEAARYVVTDLGQNFFADSINDAGEVSAYHVINGKDGSRAVVYRGGRWKRLDHSAQSSADHINEEGDVAGQADGKAVLWMRDERLLVPFADATGFSWARSVNGQRRTTGFYLKEGNFRCFVWKPGEILATDLGTPEQGPECEAMAINANNVIVGNAGTHAFVYADGAFTDLGALPGGTWSQANAVDRDGNVIGVSEDRNEVDRAVVWRPDHTIVDLDPRHAYESSVAWGINGRGLIVGVAARNGRGYAVRFGPHRITALESEVVNLGNWRLWEAVSANNKGQIVGWGVHPNGAWHGFLLTPVGDQ